MQPPPRPPSPGSTLLVVDWSEGAAQDLRSRLQSRPPSQLQARPAVEALAAREAVKGPDGSPAPGAPWALWEVLNCPADPTQAGAARTGWQRAQLALRYLGTACRAAWDSRRYAQVVVWQQAIGYLMCLLPRSPGCRLIITTVLLSPSAWPPFSLQRLCLRLALWRADALVYFSQDLAADTRRHHPRQAHKVFWMPLPHFEAETEPPASATAPEPLSAEPSMTHTAVRPLRVFAGGSSERDFDVVIRAFQGSEVPVTLVCRADQVFEPPGPQGPTFSVHREVSHAAFNALARAADVAVVALKSADSGCGQLLFTFCMQHGIPVIATDCHGTRDYVVHEQTGLLVPVGDARALREAYERLARDPALRHRLATQARARAERRGLARFLRELADISSRLQQGSQTAPPTP